MSAAWLAAAWAAVGLAFGTWGGRRRRAAALVAPLLLLGLTLAAARSGTGPRPLAGGPLSLPREGAGLLAASALALWVCLLLADRLDGRELLGIGTVGAAVVLILSTGSPLLFGVAALLGVAALTVRWITAAPSRATLAAGRVAGTGAAALVAASIVLSAVSADAEPGLVGGLLVVGVLALAGVVPLGGWAAGAVGLLRAPEIATWLLLLAPAVLLGAFSIPAALPILGRLDFDHTLLACGLLSAVWGAVQSLRALPGSRYGRLALADLGLLAAGIGSGEGVALTGGLVLILAHLVAAPLLLQPSRSGLGPPRRLVWLALSGLPPSPAFWGRFLVLQGCVAVSGTLAACLLVAAGLMTLAAVLAVARGERGEELPTPPHQVAAAWALGAVALLVGLLPIGAVHVVFGLTA